MKQWVLFLMVALLIGSVGCAKTEKKPAPLQTEKQKASYAVGYNIGQRVGQDIKNIKEDIDLETLCDAFKDAITSTDKIKNEKISEQDREKFLKDFGAKIRQKIELKQKQEGEKNKLDGDAFLKANAQKPGVVVTPSGLQYIVMEQGTGPTPKATDMVRVHYRGTLLNGTEFDSSYKRNQPAEFPLNGVIKGWIEGVQLMKVGSKYKFFVPSELAYGPNQAGELITPNSTLIFEVQLLAILPPQPKK